MPDGLTTPAPPQVDPAPLPAAEPARRPLGPGVVWQVLWQMSAVVGAFAAAGALCGWLWYLLWTPPEGVVIDHRWIPDPVEAGLRGEFLGTGWYVVVALVAGLLLGAGCAYLFDRAELVTLVAVCLGSALAAWVMLRVGLSLSPPDPHEVARTVADGTRVPGDLRVSRLPPKLAFSVGALLGLSTAYFLSARRTLARGANLTRNAGTRG